MYCVVIHLLIVIIPAPLGNVNLLALPNLD